MNSYEWLKAVEEFKENTRAHSFDAKLRHTLHENPWTSWFVADSHYDVGNEEKPGAESIMMGICLILLLAGAAMLLTGAILEKGDWGPDTSTEDAGTSIIVGSIPVMIVGAILFVLSAFF